MNLGPVLLIIVLLWCGLVASGDHVFVEESPDEIWTQVEAQDG